MPAPVGPGGAEQPLYTASFALLVGVSKYDNPSWADLASVPRELDELALQLKQVGFDTVERLTNPTGEELRRGVEAFIGRHGYDPGHRLLFFFSGHGYTLDDGQRGYFVPRDATDPLSDSPAFRRVALSMQQVASWAQDLTAKHALFVFDSCFSGSIFRTRDAPRPVAITAAVAQPVRAFMSAGDANQPVPAQSVFVPAFIRALRGAADLDRDGFVTGTELGNFVQREVIEYQQGQTPQFGKLRDPRFDAGELVFAVPTTSETAAAPARPSPTAPAGTATGTFVPNARAAGDLGGTFLLGTDASLLQVLGASGAAIPAEAGDINATVRSQAAALGLPPHAAPATAWSHYDGLLQGEPREALALGQLWFRLVLATTWAGDLGQPGRAAQAKVDFENSRQQALILLRTLLLVDSARWLEGYSPEWGNGGVAVLQKKILDVRTELGSRRLEPPPNGARPSAPRVQSPAARCSELLAKAGIGEPLSSDERAFLRDRCGR